MGSNAVPVRTPASDALRTLLQRALRLAIKPAIYIPPDGIATSIMTVLSTSIRWNLRLVKGF